MKTKLLVILLILLPFISFSQNDYAQVNDFMLPYKRSVFWSRSSIPTGSNPILTLSGTNLIIMHTDTIKMNKLAGRNDTVVYKLVSIGPDSMLRAFVPKYLLDKDTLNLSNRIDEKFSISDTTNKWLSIGYVPDWNSISNKPNFLDSNTLYTIINGKLNKIDTTGKWLPIGTYIPDTMSLSYRIDQKLNKNDTTGKWLSISTHIPADQVNSDWTSPSGKSQILNKPTLVTSYHQLTDTLNISSTNINNWNTAFSWGNPVGVYVPITRTITINGNTQDLSTNRSFIITPDSSIFLTKYANDTAKVRLTNTINLKLNISDTLNKWYPKLSNPSGYLIGNDTISLSTRINLRYLFPSGGTGLQYINGLGNLTTFPVIPILPISDYTNTSTVASGAGNVIFYLTSDKTSTGTALYTNINSVQPIVNDANLNYTYSWTISGDKKTLTVNVKAAVGLNISLLGLTLLGVPSNVANGTIVNVLVKGS